MPTGEWQSIVWLLSFQESTRRGINLTQISEWISRMELRMVAQIVTVELGILVPEIW